jgi:phosphatidylserine decarboxylase
VSLAIGTTAVIVLLFVLWRYVFFFRNPRRDVPIDPDLVLSPADGVVVYVRRVEPASGRPILSIKGEKVLRLDDLMHLDDDRLKGKAGILVGILMTPFDVHYNRAPVAGRLKKIAHDFPAPRRFPAENRCMFNALSNLVFDERPFTHDCDYVVTNERASYVIANERESVYVTQIAERWIRRIATLKDDGPVAQGEVFGLIRMGSQVDLFVPDEAGFEPRIRERQRVLAGLTVLMARTPGREAAQI